MAVIISRRSSCRPNFATAPYIIYRTRYVVWTDDPEPGSWDVVCGAVWTEDEVRALADKARERGSPLKSAEVPLAFDFNPNSPPASVFIPNQIAMPQDDPLTEEFSDLIPMKAYLTREEAEQGEDNWDDVWGVSHALDRSVHALAFSTRPLPGRGDATSQVLPLNHS